MNTPAHAVVNLVLLGRKKHPETVGPILIGAVLPDLPIVGFYFFEKFVRGMPEGIIWTRAYYEAGWQACFDLFHSLPLIAAGFLVAHRREAQRSRACFASLGLHALGDFLFHHDDAHRHFYPFLNWRFESPVSYWDPRHYGEIAGRLELIAVLAGLAILARRATSAAARGLVACVIAVYAAYWVYALWVWG